MADPDPGIAEGYEAFVAYGNLFRKYNAPELIDEFRKTLAANPPRSRDEMMKRYYAFLKEKSKLKKYFQLMAKLLPPDQIKTADAQGFLEAVHREGKSVNNTVEPFSGAPRGRTIKAQSKPPVIPKGAADAPLGLTFQKKTSFGSNEGKVKIVTPGAYKKPPNFVPFTIEAPPLRLRGQPLFPLSKEQMVHAWQRLDKEHALDDKKMVWPRAGPTSNAATITSETADIIAGHEATIADKDSVIAAKDSVIAAKEAEAAEYVSVLLGDEEAVKKLGLSIDSASLIAERAKFEAKLEAKDIAYAQKKADVTEKYIAKLTDWIIKAKSEREDLLHHVEDLLKIQHTLPPNDVAIAQQWQHEFTETKTKLAEKETTIKDRSERLLRQRDKYHTAVAAIEKKGGDLELDDISDDDMSVLEPAEKEKNKKIRLDVRKKLTQGKIRVDAKKKAPPAEPPKPIVIKATPKAPVATLGGGALSPAAAAAAAAPAVPAVPAVDPEEEKRKKEFEEYAARKTIIDDRFRYWDELARSNIEAAVAEGDKQAFIRNLEAIVQKIGEDAVKYKEKDGKPDLRLSQLAEQYQAVVNKEKADDAYKTLDKLGQDKAQAAGEDPAKIIALLKPIVEGIKQHAEMNKEADGQPNKKLTQLAESYQDEIDKAQARLAGGAAAAKGGDDSEDDDLAAELAATPKKAGKTASLLGALTPSKETFGKVTRTLSNAAKSLAGYSTFDWSGEDPKVTIIPGKAHENVTVVTKWLDKHSSMSDEQIQKDRKLFESIVNHKNYNKTVAGELLDIISKSTKDRDRKGKRRDMETLKGKL